MNNILVTDYKLPSKQNTNKQVQFTILTMKTKSDKGDTFSYIFYCNFFIH